MTLRALHFAIQRVFGLTDQHHHNFALTDEDFESVTAGRLGGYLDLCGILFRFLDIWLGDAIRTEEYDARKSYKAWERKKYCAPFQADSIGDDDYDEGDYEDDYEDDYFDDFDEADCDENDEDADYENYRIYRETYEYNLMKEVVSSNMVDKRIALDRFRYRDSGNREVEEELRKTLAEIDVKGRPRCVAVDGLNPVENVGGVIKICEGDEEYA